MTPPLPALRTLGRGTLSRELVLRVTALVAVVAIFLSALTALAMREILLNQLDEQLRATSARIRDPGSRGSLAPVGGPGQAQGLLLYVQEQGGFVQVERSHDALDDGVVTALEGLVPEREPVTRVLPSLGEYRLLVTTREGRTLVTGLPTATLASSMLTLLLATGALTVLAIGLAFVAAREVVERSLRPLARLATTATQVSGLELRSGDVAVPVRVAPRDADARSEVGQVGIAFNRMLDNVEGALAARQASETKLRRFVADASHELRNPLAAIRGYAELTRRDRAEAPATTAHALRRIESESERMSRLVEDLLLLARLDSGPAIALAPTHVNPLLVDAISDARAAGPDHTWTLSLPEDDVVALGDPHRLLQVMANLLANARTHTPPGTRVHAALTRQDRWAVVAITDDGPGIPPEIRDTLFERFTRGDASRVRAAGGGQSTGLGLAIVAAVVAAHGGDVRVESGPAPPGSRSGSPWHRMAGTNASVRNVEWVGGRRPLALPWVGDHHLHAQSER
ncbi:MAG: sensor histidine kinase [Actinomycetes bacterium]